MPIYTIADLHLAGSKPDEKSMAVFGRRWIGATDKLIKNWNAVVNDTDTVIIPGDISWAMNLDEAYNDFALIDSLPGTKYIGKGNHDFWWSTVSKMTAYFESNGFNTIKILYNNSAVLKEGIICGSRGWFPDEANQKTAGNADWQKIINRETLRLGLSLKSVPAECSDLPLFVFLHFPPVWNGAVCRGIVDLLHEYNVNCCYFGHIHNVYTVSGEYEFEGIRFRMISADYLDFCPRLVAGHQN